MKLALACVSCLVVATAAEAAPPEQRPQRQSFVPKSSAAAAELWSLQQLPNANDPRLPSPSQFQELMDGLPLISDRSDDAGDDKGFSFKVKPGKGVKAIARLRF